MSDGQNAEPQDGQQAPDPLADLIQRVEAIGSQVQAILATSGGTRPRREDQSALVGGLSQSAEIGDLAMALAAAQAELVNPGLNKEAAVDLKGGGGYRHRFADLPEILGTIRPILGKHGLAFMQVPTITAGSTFLITRLMHSSGQWLQSALPLPNLGGRIQEWGGSLTYLRRYTIASIVGIAGADEDDDGNGVDGNTAHITDRQRGGPVKSAAPPKNARRQPPPEDRGPPPDHGDPGPQDPGQGPPPDEQRAGGPSAEEAAMAAAQKALRDLPKQIKACFDPNTGEIDMPRAESVWMAHADHLRIVQQHTVDALVDRFHDVMKRLPPPIEGVTYIPPTERQNG